MKKLLLTVILAAGTFAHADIKKIEADYTKCAENAVSTLDSNNCAYIANEAADKELNEFYSELTSAMKKSGQAEDKEILSRLIKSERAWITYRDTNCDLAGTQMLGGTGEGMIINGCIASETIKRVKDLQSIFSGGK